MYFDFLNLIQKYSTEFTLITETKGGIDEYGDYQAGEKKETVMTAAIINFSQNKIIKSNGALSEKDLALYSLVELSDKLIGSTIIYKNNKYTLDSVLNNSEFTGVFAYKLKWCSAFGGGAV